MAKFLFHAAYTAEGLDGLLQEGGSLWRDAIAAAVASLGGRLEAFYFAFGDADMVGILDLPDNISAAAFALLITAAGGISVHTTVLLTPEEVDEAVHKRIEYRAPGN
jgi:uncharacterized protein with GYD domain